MSVRILGFLPALSALAACGYYTSHKILHAGEEVKDWKAYHRYQEALETEHPRRIRFPYVSGAVKELRQRIVVGTDEVPSRIEVEARGHNGEIQGISVLARYRGTALEPDRAYSATLGADRTRTIIDSEAWLRTSTFRGLMNPRPEKPIRLEIWFKAICYFKGADDRIIVRALFDGTEAGRTEITWDMVGPVENPVDFGQRHWTPPDR